MSIKLMSMVFDASGLKPTHKLVLLCLCDCAADDGTSVYPAVSTIANRTALNPSTVRKTIHELRDKTGLNLISIARLYTSKRPNVYKINVDNLRVLCGSRVLPDSAQGATTAHPRVLPRSTDPSVDPSVDPSIGGAKKMRPRNAMFDALVEVTNSDPKAAGGYIGKTASDLSDYDPEKVRRWYSPGGWWYRVRCRNMDNPQPPTLAGVAKSIAQAAEYERTGGRKPIKLTNVVTA